jgi:hypothetical protein
MRRYAMCVCLFLALVATMWGEDCSRESGVSDVAKVKAVQAELLATKVGDHGMDTTVPPVLQKQIRALKDALAVLIDGQMRCEAGEAPDAATLERSLAERLGANKPEHTREASAGEWPEVMDGIYGNNLWIGVQRPKNMPRLIALKVSFNIDCSSDSMLLIYEQKNGTWQQALRWQSGDYEEISGAFGDFFEYAVVPQGSNAWAVAVAHGHPWCTSRMSGFDIDVVRPIGTENPQVLFHKNDSYSRFNIDPVMKATRDGFDLRLERDALDMDFMTRPGIFRYRVSEKKVERTQPIAMNGRDFVDEWLQIEWADAAKWCAAGSIESLRRIHAENAKLFDPKASSWPELTYGSVRGCSDDPKHYQVEVQMDPGTPTYFQIRQGENSFTMLSASRTPNSRCKGPDIMKKAECVAK